jgi:hypothetical protein
MRAKWRCSVKDLQKIFVVCPVRNVDELTKSCINKYVCDLERDGRTICHWPSRDTDQNDPIGFNICAENRRAIHESDEVHIWYDSNSQGSLFDVGMLFAFLLTMEKRVVIINPEDVKPTPHKSFQNVLLALSKAPS